MIPSTARFVVRESHEPTARRPSGRVSPSSGEDHRSSSSPCAVRGDNRLGFSGEAQFGMSAWRQRLGEENITALLQESLSVAHRIGAIEIKGLERVAVDTTVQE